MTLWQRSHAGDEVAPPGQGLVLSTEALGHPPSASTGRAASAGREPSHPTVAEGRASVSSRLGREMGVFTKQFSPLWTGRITLPPLLIIQAAQIKILVAANTKGVLCKHSKNNAVRILEKLKMIKSDNSKSK